jgi:hypothetical protein
MEKKILFSILKRVEGGKVMMVLIILFLQILLLYPVQGFDSWLCQDHTSENDHVEGDRREAVRQVEPPSEPYGG